MKILPQRVSEALLAEDRSTVYRYGVVTAVVLAATCVRLALNPLLGPHAPYLPFALAVMFAARIGGRGPGFAATALSTLSILWFFVEPQSAPSLWNSGAIAGLVLFAVVGALISVMIGHLRESLSERKRTEEALGRSETQFRTLANAIPQLCWMAKGDGWIFWYNDRWYEYTGTTPQDMEGWGWQSVHDPSVLPDVLGRWKGSIASGQPFDMVFPIRGADGVFRPFLTRVVPVRDGDGTIVRWFGTNTDITEERRSEEALRQASEQRRLALESAQMGAWDYRFDTGDVYWDERARSMYGISSGLQIEYDAAIARIHEDDRASTNEAVKRAIEGANGGAYDREYRVVWPDRSVHWVASHGRVLFEGEGEQRRAVRFVGVNMDITDRRHADERLRQTQKMESIGLLAGGVAHDFNNLLTVIMGSASTALAERPSCEYSQAILSASERAAYLTRQLLAYAGKGHNVINRNAHTCFRLPFPRE